MPKEELVDVVVSMVKKTTDLTLENMFLKNKLNVAIKALNLIAYPPDEFDDPSDRAQNALDEIEKIK